MAVFRMVKPDTLGVHTVGITLLPALFMTGVCSTYLFISKQAFGLQEDLAYYLGILTVIIAMVWFVVWIRKYGEKEREIGETSTD